MADLIQATATATFDHDVLGLEQPVLVDFYADWCAPCKAVAPVVAELARTHAGRLAVRKVDVDRNPELAQRYGIRGIPTLLLFKDGAVADSLVGAVSQQQLRTVVDAHLG